MNRLLHYDRRGEVIDFPTWVSLMEDARYRAVKLTELGDARCLSTQWMGFDLNVSAATAKLLGIELPAGVSRPLIFETMLCTPHGPDGMRRYATEEDAIAGHDAWLAQLEAEAEARR